MIYDKELDRIREEFEYYCRLGQEAEKEENTTLRERKTRVVIFHLGRLGREVRKVGRLIKRDLAAG